ncbi:MAG: hypothetical protein Q9160_002589 [Pyrenula sp. 1 TL-2023]
MVRLIAAIAINGIFSGFTFANPIDRVLSQEIRANIALGHLESFHGSQYVAWDTSEALGEEACPSTFAMKTEDPTHPSYCDAKSVFTAGRAGRVTIECDQSNPHVPKYVLDSSGVRAGICEMNKTRPAVCAEGGSFLHQTYLCTFKASKLESAYDLQPGIQAVGAYWGGIAWLRVVADYLLDIRLA